MPESKRNMKKIARLAVPAIKKLHISEKIGNFVAGNPKKVVAVFAVLFLLTLPFLTQLYIYLSVYEVSPVRPYLDDFKHLNADLGWDNWGFIMCVPKGAQSVSEPDAVREINAVCDRLEELPWVESTVSLSMLVKYVNNMAPAPVGSYTFPPDNAAGDQQINLYLQTLFQLMGNVAYGNIIGRPDANGNHPWTLIIVMMEKGQSGEQYRAWQRDLLKYGQELDANNPYADQLTMYPMSMDIIYSSLDDAAVTEGPIWVVTAVLVDILSILWLFRKKSDVIISLFVMAIVIGAALTVMVITNTHFNVLSMVLIAMILGSGIDYCLHTIARYKEERALGKSSRTSANDTIRNSMQPLFIMASTTTGGFAALYLCQIPAVGAFGVILGISIFLAYIVSMIFIPAMLELFVRRRERIDGVADTDSSPEESIKIEQALRNKQRTSLMGRIGSFVVRHSKAVFAIFAVSIVLLCIPLVSPGPQQWGGSYITAYTPEPVQRGVFPEDTYAMKVLRLVDQTMGIPNEIAVVVKGDMTDRNTLLMMKDLQARLDSADNGVHGRMKTDSVLTVLQIYFVMNPQEDTNRDGIPDGNIRASYDKAFQDRAMGVMMERVLSRDYTFSAIRLGCNPQPKDNSLGSDMQNYWKTRHDVEAKIAEVQADYPNLNVKISDTGLIVLGTEVDDAIRVGNNDAMYLMFVVVFLIVFAFWRRVSLSLLAMIPITTSIIVQYSLTAAFGFEITYVSLILTGMVMGIGVDDAVHLISRMREEINRGKTPEEAAILSNAEIGRVLVATTVTTVAPFVPIMLGSIVLWAQQTAMIVLPALLGGELAVTVCVLPVICVWHAKHFPKSWLNKGNTLEKIAQMRTEEDARREAHEAGQRVEMKIPAPLPAKRIEVLKPEPKAPVFPKQEAQKPEAVAQESGKVSIVKMKKRAVLKNK
ncbi:MAG: efflux RND transporter permease subunit [Candidatus Thermoplasmatota archaeon]|nr:efflux RND transporter permease subunit [Candidatus Thermoplasmatota archaeon]